MGAFPSCDFVLKKTHFFSSYRKLIVVSLSFSLSSLSSLFFIPPLPREKKKSWFQVPGFEPGEGAFFSRGSEGGGERSEEEREERKKGIFSPLSLSFLSLFLRRENETPKLHKTPVLDQTTPHLTGFGPPAS